MERLRKNMNHGSQESNPGPSEYEALTLTTTPQRSVTAPLTNYMEKMIVAQLVKKFLAF
jgi:hypothetical protein